MAGQGSARAFACCAAVPLAGATGLLVSVRPSA